jgi:transcriptional regulator with XRE-family HTH domain
MTTEGNRGGPPHRIDVCAGARLRQRRLLLGMNQEDLAALLRVSFQQVQKYEKGTNRMSAGLLHHIAGLLEVPVARFFEPLDADAPVDRDELELIALYQQLPLPTATVYLALLQHAGAGAAT